jgi:hypothetical protein
VGLRVLEVERLDAVVHQLHGAPCLVGLGSND